MGVAAPIGVTRFYYFAYPVGILVAFGTFWLLNKIHPPKIMFPLKEWHEPKNYVRPEEDGSGGIQTLEGHDMERASQSSSAEVGEKALGIREKVEFLGN
jgi:NCS1 family nucleobase:cation symporter-1